MTSIDTARQVLKDLYGVDAELTALYGEFDDNFLAITDGGKKRILKIMHEGCSVQRVDLQCRAMAHLANATDDVNLPRVIPAESGQLYSIAGVDGTDRLVWLLKFCPGTLLADFKPHTEDLMRSFGRMMGNVDAGLKSFTHPAMRQGHQWELTRATASRPHLRHLGGEAARLVAKTLSRVEKSVLQKLETLPYSVIHNDANDRNVLVNTMEDGRAVVDGLFDFGDITYQPVVCDAAIALAYAVLGKDQPLPVCAVFLEGYSAVNPLSSEELALLHDLIMARLAVSIAVAAGRRARDPSDAYNSAKRVSEERALAQLAETPPQLAERTFLKACRLETGP